MDVTEYDCQHCGRSGRRYRGRTLAGLTLETCRRCVYLLGNTAKPLPVEEW